MPHPGPKPTPQAGIGDPTSPKPPKQLRGGALREWKRVVPLLMAKGILSHVDLAALAMYCKEFDRWQRAEDILDAQGELVKTKSGNVIHHPALGISRTAEKLVHKFAAEFGLTPSARTRFKSAATDDETDDDMEVPA